MFKRPQLVVVVLSALLFAQCRTNSPTAPSVPPPVNTVNAPTVTSIAPNNGAAGAATQVTITGTGFTSGASIATSGAGIGVSDVTVVNTTTLTARFTVDAAADLGARSITVTTTGGTSSAATFTVGAPSPTLTSISPSTGVPGSRVTVTLTGSSLVPGSTTIAVSGDGISVQEVSGPAVAATGRTMTAVLVIDANAAPGPRTITVTTPGGSGSATFNVTSRPPTIETFKANPVRIAAGDSSRLSWTGITNATTCSINNGIGTVPCADGSIGVTPSRTTEYQLMTVGAGGREWMYVTVNVEQPATNARGFDFTGGTQSFVVPANVDQITVTVFGAQGGFGPGPSLSERGLGGQVVATLPVTPGEELTIIVGGAGEDSLNQNGGFGGFNGGARGGTSVGSGGGGGGGASEVKRGSTTLVIAGGGGGGGGGGFLAGAVGGAGGSGGGFTGGTGGIGSSGVSGGTGGSQFAGGDGGTSFGVPAGSIGTLRFGGTGAGNGAATSAAGGGGGGGYFGGGGGGGSNLGNPNKGGGGGGGSSYTAPSAFNVTHVQGVRSGNGQIVITW